MCPGSSPEKTFEDTTRVRTLARDNTLPSIPPYGAMKCSLRVVGADAGCLAQAPSVVRPCLPSTDNSKVLDEQEVSRLHAPSRRLDPHPSIHVMASDKLFWSVCEEVLWRGWEEAW